ncbi:MAG TPA: rhomboid family intramembrane serine protease [Geobacteraceae bacterium]
METENDEHGEEWLDVPAGGEAVSLSAARVWLWALVLEARYIPCRVEEGEHGWRLLVPPPHLEAARRELGLFEEENRDWPPSPSPALPVEVNTLAALSVLILLATFYNLTRLDLPLFGHVPPDWVTLGSARVAAILTGQWWRVVTALTLHADVSHLLGNLAIGGVFIVFLCRDVGSGLAWALVLAAGILGNLANACVQPWDHTSVGASTAVFGAVGIHAALTLVRQRHLPQRWRALPVAGALALLALLGTEGKQTDLGAHLFGLAYGVCLGLVAAYCVERYGRPGRVANWFFALGSGATVVGAWWWALVSG